jgi:hypothetical protein
MITIVNAYKLKVPNATIKAWLGASNGNNTSMKVNFEVLSSNKNKTCSTTNIQAT